MIKLVVSDIDGTLVPDGSHEINQEIFSVIRQLKEKGVQFVAASGRQFISMKRLFEPVAEDILYITDGGTIVRDCHHIMDCSVMEEQDVKKITEDILTVEDCDVILCGKESVYVMDEKTEMSCWLKDSYHFDLTEIKNLNEKFPDEMVKVSMYHKNDAEHMAEQLLIPNWGDKYQISCAGVMWMDCTNKDANKGTALQYLQKKLHISKEETMVFGDNLNDIEMLQEAYYSVAIGNAREEVKKAARFVADTNVNDGVLKELKKLLINI